MSRPNRGTNDLLKENGVLVTKVDDTRMISKIWSCIVHMEAPKMVNLNQWFTNVTHLINGKGASFFGKTQLDYWHSRLEGIRQDTVKSGFYIYYYYDPWKEQQLHII